MKIRIHNDERGLVFKHGNYVKHLKPSKKRYFLMPFRGYHVTVVNVNRPFPADKEFNLFTHDPQLMDELIVIDVKDYELALHFEEEKLVGVYRVGKYIFWKALKKHEVKMVDLRNPEIGPEFLPYLPNPKLNGCFSVATIAANEEGLLYFNNQFQRVIPPGLHYFWNGAISVTVNKIDLRQQQIDMTGQEIMTEDKVTLRLNFICQYKIVDSLKVVQIKDYEEQIYILLQLILREYVGSYKLDDLLLKKEEIGQFVLARLQAKNAHFGVEFIDAGVKDIILPGDVKDILNTVLIAEKKAQANVISRREEIASTRSLMNTAKLMDENQTLYRLKELEFLEKICEKIGNISLTGGGGLLEQLNALLAARKEK